MNPLITVGIPTVSRLNLLREAVGSALAQTYPHVEVLISQDPAPQGLNADVRAWSLSAAQDPRVRYVANPSPKGLSGNWNAVGAAARGTYVVIMGDDDRLLPEFAESLIGSCREDVDLLFSNHHVIDRDGKRIPGEGERWSTRYHRDVLPAGEITKPEIAAWRGSVPASSSLVRTSQIRALPFREDLNTPDLDFTIRLARAGGRFFFVPRNLTEYRAHLGSATSAGLWIHKLVPYLLEMSVDREVEPFKRECLEGLLMAATTLSLLEGDRAAARRFLKSPYYPRRGRWSPIAMAQVACAALPAGVGAKAVEALRKLRAAARRHVALSVM